MSGSLVPCSAMTVSVTASTRRVTGGSAWAAAPLAAFICSHPGARARILAEHVDDGTGHCRRCSAGGQTGRYVWPCVLHVSAAGANG